MHPHLLSLEVWFPQLLESIISGPFSQILYILEVGVRSKFQIFVQISDHRIIQ